MFGRGLGLGLLRGRGRVFWMCVRNEFSLLRVGGRGEGGIAYAPSFVDVMKVGVEMMYS